MKNSNESDLSRCHGGSPPPSPAISSIASPFRNVLVIGGLSGRIGRGIVYHLAPRARVFALGRDAESVRAANERGIPLYVGDRLERLGGADGLPVTFVRDVLDAPMGKDTLVISATTASAVIDSLRNVPDRARILTIENGWDTPDRVRALNPTWDVSGGVAWFSCKAHPALSGFDRVTPGGYIAVEPASTAIALQLLELWGPDHPIRLAPQSSPEKRKAIANSMYNGLGIIFDSKLGEVLAMPGYKALMRALAQEGVIAARFAGCDVGTADDLFAMAYAIGSRNAADHTSAYAMMAKGIETEVPTINGAIANEGAEHDVLLPINRFITSAIAQMTRWRAELGSLDQVFDTHAREIDGWRHHLLSLGHGFHDGPPGASAQQSTAPTLLSVR